MTWHDLLKSIACPFAVCTSSTLGRRHHQLNLPKELSRSQLRSEYSELSLLYHKVAYLDKHIQKSTGPKLIKDLFGVQSEPEEKDCHYFEPVLKCIISKEGRQSVRMLGRLHIDISSRNLSSRSHASSHASQVFPTARSGQAYTERWFFLDRLVDSSVR